MMYQAKNSKHKSAKSTHEVIGDEIVLKMWVEGIYFTPHFDHDESCDRPKTVAWILNAPSYYAATACHKKSRWPYLGNDKKTTIEDQLVAKVLKTTRFSVQFLILKQFRKKATKCKQTQKHSVKPKGPPTRSVLVPSYKTRDELLTEHGMLQRYEYDVEFCIRDRGTRLHPEVQAGWVKAFPASLSVSCWYIYSLK